MLEIKQAKVARDRKRQNLERRLDYARHLLTQTVEPLSDVAVCCGWKNQEFFAEAFKKYVGVTPEHYRNWHRL